MIRQNKNSLQRGKKMQKKIQNAKSVGGVTYTHSSLKNRINKIEIINKTSLLSKWQQVFSLIFEFFYLNKKLKEEF